MSEFNLQHLRNINANLLSGGEKSTSIKGATSGRTIIVSRNIKKAENILFNVCKGKFPGLIY